MVTGDGQPAVTQDGELSVGPKLVSLALTRKVIFVTPEVVAPFQMREFHVVPDFPESLTTDERVPSPVYTEG